MRLLTVGSLPPEWGGPRRGGVATFHASLLTGLLGRPDVEVVGVLPPTPLDRAVAVPAFPPPQERGRARFYADLLERLRPDAVLMNHIANAMGVAHARLRSPVPALGVVHSWHNVTFRTGEAQKQALELTREAMTGMTALAVPSRHGIAEGRRLGFRYPAIVAPIPNPLQPMYMDDGIDVSAGERRDVVYLGGLIPRKDPAVLVEAAALLPGARAVLVGEGELRGDLQALINRLSLSDRVRLAEPPAGEGHLDYIRDTLLRARLLCLPSRSESFGLVFIEALACGAPVVGFGPVVREIRDELGMRDRRAAGGWDPRGGRRCDRAGPEHELGSQRAASGHARGLRAAAGHGPLCRAALEGSRQRPACSRPARDRRGELAVESLERVDFCVTTFKRPRAIERLILSLGEHCPTANVYIGDQNEALDHRFYSELASRSGLVAAPEIHHLGFDCGLSVARNHLVTSTPGEYKLILEDDFVFTEKTDVGLLVRLLDGHPSAGVVGGGFAFRERVLQARATLHRKDGALAQIPDKKPLLSYRGIRYTVADFVSNFALMRQDLFAHVQWDPALKVFEHTDFFIRVMDTPYSVLFTPDAVIDHPPIEPGLGYDRFRQRDEYLRQMLEKHQLTRLEMGKMDGVGEAEFYGLVIELRSDGSLAKFMEKR